MGLNVLVESQLPTLGLLLLLASHWMTPYQVLVAPAVFIYFLFIVLSTLRFESEPDDFDQPNVCSGLPLRDLLHRGEVSGFEESIWAAQRRRP